MYGPTGIGVLYGRRDILSRMQPYQTGGEMIQSVTIERTTFNELPYRFEAGTPDYIGAIALAEAIHYISRLGMTDIEHHEQQLMDYALRRLTEIDGLHVVGRASHRSAVISFNVAGIHPYDLGELLDKLGIAIRTGHHCAQPLIDRFNLPGTARISFGIYNTMSEIDVLTDALKRVVPMLRR